MKSIDSIKREIISLYEANTELNVYIKTTHSPLVIKTSPAVIKAVYNNLFLIDVTEDGVLKHHSFTYGDVLIGQIEIKELDHTPINGVLNKKG